MGISDKITDGIASTVSGKRIRTTMVSLDEIMRVFDEALKQVGKEEVGEIEKVVKGSFWTPWKTYDTKDQKYRFSTLYAGTIGSHRVMNEFSIMDIENGEVYTHKAFLFKKKIKQNAKNILNNYR